jgi:hypothetical protein
MWLLWAVWLKDYYFQNSLLVYTQWKYADIGAKRRKINGIIKESQIYQIIPFCFDSELQKLQNIRLILKTYTVSPDRCQNVTSN